MDQKVVQILQELEQIEDRFTKFWNVPHTTARFLHTLVQATKVQKLLEIGTSNGYSGIYFAEALSHTGGKLYTVESNKERFAIAQKNFEKSGLTNIQQILGHAPEILVDMEGGFDFAFMDGTKIEYKKHLDVLLGKMRKGSLIVADNAGSHAKEMKDFLEFVQSSERLQSVLLPFDNGLMLSLVL